MTSQGQPVRFEGAAKSYGPVQALRSTTLAVDAGEFLTLLGPSGSGKTTLLNVVAGYVEPSAGRVFIGGRDVTGLPARRRNVGMVFQNYALFPHLNVLENVAYGLRVRRLPSKDISRRVAEALDLVQLGDLAERNIDNLSGGQQQRVALARALVIEPDVLLMDEPLGALDRQLRKLVQLEIRRLHTAHRRTTIYVTHDQEEALVMSDRVAVMRAGRLEQIGTAGDLYERPANTFVARFLGESNLLDGTVLGAAGGRAELAVPGLPAPICGPASDGLAAGTPAAALIRPEHVKLGATSEADIQGRVAEVVYLGELHAVRLTLSNGQEIWCRRFVKDGLPSGDTLTVGWDAQDIRILPIAIED